MPLLSFNFFDLCTVEGEEAEENGVYSGVSSPEVIDQPLYHDIEDSVRSSFHEIMAPVQKPTLRSPLPTMRLKQSFSHDDLQSMMYEEPVCDFDGTDNYHILKDNGSGCSTMERSRSLNEEWYDDVGVNDAVVYTMNKHPPPIWRPEQDRMKPPLPPNRRAVSSEPDDVTHRKGALPLPSHAGHASPGHKPIPLPKSVSSTGDVSGSSVGRQLVKNDMFGIRDNPVFKKKLQEKRQEIYGPASPYHGRSLSVGEGEDLAQESYESVLFTVGDTEDVPTLPPKTASMRRHMMSPPPPPLPSRELVKPPPTTLHPEQQGSPLHRGLFKPHEPVSPARHSGGSTPTSPPPLPSRELLDPSRPCITATLLPGRQEEAEEAPPIPLRLSSNRQGNISSLPPRLPVDRPPPSLPVKPELPAPGQEHGQARRRRNSLPSPHPSPKFAEPDVSDLDRRRPVPIPTAAHRSRVEAPPFTQALAQCLSVPNSKVPQLKPKSFNSPTLTRQEVVSQDDEIYDDTVQNESEDFRDNFKPYPSPSHHRYRAEVERQHLSDGAASPASQERTAPPPQNRVAPPKVSPRRVQRERSPKQSPPIPLNKSFPVLHDHLSGSQGVAKPKPPAKPAVARKPALAEKPAVAKKPAIAEKPAVARKPVVAARNVARKPVVIPQGAGPPVVTPRKPIAPPTPPKRYRATADSIPPQSPPHLQTAPSSLDNKHRVKPLLPKKPVPSLCS